MENILSFSRKIDIILKLKELNIKDIEKSLGVDGTFYKAYNENREPREKLVLEFLRKFHVKESWWKSPVGDQYGDVFEKNGTYVETRSDNREKTADEIYRDLVESNTEYRLVPKSVLNEEYRIMLKSAIDTMDDMRAEIIASQKVVIEAKNETIQQLKREIASLESQLRQTVVTPHTQKA